MDEYTSMTDDPTDYLHVVPVNDTYEHVLDGCECWCRPMEQSEGDSILIVHNANDGRDKLH